MCAIPALKTSAAVRAITFYPILKVVAAATKEMALSTPILYLESKNLIIPGGVALSIPFILHFDER